MKKTLSILALVALTLVSFTAAAFAAGAVVPEDGSLLDLAKPVYEAVMHGQWWLGASLALVLCVGLFKRYAPAKAQEWAHSDVGGSILVLAGSFGGALATGLVAAGTNALTPGLAWMALKVALAAAGGYSLIKKLLGPLVAKAPAWMQPILGMLMWVFDSKPAITKAEEAGKEAVEAKPAAGIEGVVGSSTEVK